MDETIEDTIPMSLGVFDGSSFHSKERLTGTNGEGGEGLRLCWDTC
jgi:hypothetical protein